MRSILRAVLLSLFLSVPTASLPQGSAVPGALARLEARVAAHPSDSALLFFLAREQARSGDAKAAAATLRKLAVMADGYLPPASDGFEKVWNDADFAAAVRELDARLPRLDFAPIAFQVEDPLLIPEGLAYDAPSHAFFMGSVAAHKILRIDSDQHVVEFAGAAADLDSVLGLAVDAPRRRL